MTVDDRQARLAAALRANLKRRKAAAPPPPEKPAARDPAPRETDEPEPQ